MEINFIALPFVITVLAFLYAFIPKSDWWVVTRFMILCGFLWIICTRVLPEPLNIMAFAWVVIGQGVLVKERVMEPYPISLKRTFLSFYKAAIWPKYCFKNEPK